MPRRGDNIRKRKDDKREARYIFKNPEGNRKKYGSVYRKSYLEVKEKREKIIKHNTSKNVNDQVLFKDILAAWQAANRIRIKGSSVSRYQNLIDTHILPELGNKKVSQINTAAINRFLSSKLEHGRIDGKGGLSASYVRSISLIISSAIKYGVAEKLCPPLLSPITKPSVSKKELYILCPVTQSVLEQELLNGMTEEKLLIYITLYTGLRIGEACALRWENIDLDAGIISVCQTVSRIWYSENGKKFSKLTVSPPKSHSSVRMIPICSKLFDVIQQFPNKKKQGYVLSGDNAPGFTSPRTFEYRYKQILKKCNLQLFNYHTLRHTFATRCVERGVDTKSLSEILGHASVSVTLNTYVHSSIELKKRQLEKLTA